LVGRYDPVRLETLSARKIDDVASVKTIDDILVRRSPVKKWEEEQREVSIPSDILGKA